MLIGLVCAVNKVAEWQGGHLDPIPCPPASWIKHNLSIVVLI